MEEIVKHINDTNASYRDPNAGDAKNTDLFLDNEHYELFQDCGEQVTVRFNKENLTKAILFISTVLPRKFDQSTTHALIRFSKNFVLDQLSFLDALFTDDGKETNFITQVWNSRKDVPKKNGEIDKRFYFNGLLKEVTFLDHNGITKQDKFTIRNYLVGGFSELHIKKANDGIFDINIQNVTTPYDDGKEKGLEIEDRTPFRTGASLQQIFYGAPGTGKSYTIDNDTKEEDVIRTTFHPDSDYPSFVGAYKPTTIEETVMTVIGTKAVPVENEDGTKRKESKIIYEFVSQAFLQAYVAAWKKYAEADEGDPQKQFLIIEEINRGNCAQIFGDLFQLLDRNDSGFSDYPIKADADMKRQLAKAFRGLSLPNASHINALYDGRDVVKDVLDGDILLLPNNLYIWATMNTSDQSLFPIDSAFKRRWDWKYMPISDAHLDWVIDINESKYDWWQFLVNMNEKIGSTTNSEDKKLGYFFCKAKDGIISAENFVGKVIFYLWNDVFKDFEFSDAIFNDSDGSKLSFAKFYTEDGKQSTIIYEKVTLFLKNLGLEPMEYSDDSQEYEGQNDPSSPIMEDKSRKWSDTETKRYEFWDAFLKYANAKNEDFAKYFGSRKTPSHDKWYNFPMGHPDCYLVAEQTRSRNELELQVYFNQTTDNYYKLLEHKENIEKEMETSYNWFELAEKKASKITEVKHGVDLEDKSQWETAFDFFIDRLLRMRTVFLKYLNL